MIFIVCPIFGTILTVIIQMLITNSNDGHNWILANDCISKSKNLDVPLVEDICIIIASLQIFGFKKLFIS